MDYEEKKDLLKMLESCSWESEIHLSNNEIEYVVKLIKNDLERDELTKLLHL